LPQPSSLKHIVRIEAADEWLLLPINTDAEAQNWRAAAQYDSVLNLLLRPLF